MSSSEAIQKIRHLYGQVLSLLIYRNILDALPSRACLDLLHGLQSDPIPQESELLRLYGQWFYAVSETEGWQAWIERFILTADNPFTQQAQRCNLLDLPENWVQAVHHDLNVLQQWAIVGPSLIQSALYSVLRTQGQIPFPTPCLGVDQSSFKFADFANWSESVPALSNYYRQTGVGLFSQYQALRWRAGTLEGIAHPDAIQLADLVGYDWQKKALQQNTEALLAGYSALNVLLYGSRGSGKSALIKALRSEYGDRGLRLIELNKADMIDLPQVVEHLRTSVLKFVIFIDDLSFEEEEDSYKALKVVLEGNLTARPQNVVVYATSNRRHLIREFFGDRPRPSQADEIHSWDTVQEKLSLSDRFGLTLTFDPANQQTYLQIVHHLAQQNGIEMATEDLEHQALQWAVRQNVRSGRTARQFIDQVTPKLG